MDTRFFYRSEQLPKLSERLAFRVTEDEKAKLVRLARIRGVTFSALARLLFLQALSECPDEIAQERGS